MINFHILLSCLFCSTIEQTVLCTWYPNILPMYHQTWVVHFYIQSTVCGPDVLLYWPSKMSSSQWQFGYILMKAKKTLLKAVGILNFRKISVLCQWTQACQEVTWLAVRSQPSLWALPSSKFRNLTMEFLFVLQVITNYSILLTVIILFLMSNPLSKINLFNL